MAEAEGSVKSAPGTPQKLQGSLDKPNETIDSAGTPEADVTNLPPPARPKPQKPGQWDGRVGGLSVKQYRALKWGSDAGFKLTMRGGPSYSFRPRPPLLSKSSTDVINEIDVYKSFKTTQPSVPSYSCGRLPIVHGIDEKSPGPNHYGTKTIFGSQSHPTLGKDLGRQFGRERLIVNDETSPAPGDYDLRGFEKLGRYKRHPDFTIQGREAWRDPPVAPGPGCGDYQYDEVFKNGVHKGTRWTVQGKTEMTQPPTGAAATRLRKRLDQLKRSCQFEKEIDFKKISPILLALEAPALMEICKKLQDNASLIKDPNTFLVAAAMKKLGNSGGYGARKPVMPGPTHYDCPGAGGPDYAHVEQPPTFKFGREHRGLIT